MRRFRLFILFAGMSVISLLRPRHGEQFIQDAEAGAAERAIRKRVQEVFP